jgi:prepilin-type N-terminal cleavage/methylation domain-containing protein
MEEMMPVSKNPQSGFSLAEMLVAIMILAVGLLGLAELQVTAMKANAQSDSISVANTLAQKVVEEIMAMGTTESTDLFSTATGTSPKAWVGSPYIVPGAGSYNVTFDVVPTHSGVTGLSQITVHVQSASAIANVLGNRIRSVDAVVLKRL